MLGTMHLDDTVPGIPYPEITGYRSDRIVKFDCGCERRTIITDE